MKALITQLSLWAALVLCSASPGWATLTFNLTQEACTTGCNVTPYGTITLTDTSLNHVSVQVALDPNYSFRHSNDSNHWALVFNLSGTPAVTYGAFTDGPTTQTFNGN